MPRIRPLLNNIPVFEKRPFSPSFDLQYFADDSPTGLRTEKPTERRIRKAREHGQVAKSIDLNSVVVLFAGFAALYFFGHQMRKEMQGFLTYCLGELASPLSGGKILQIVTYMMFVFGYTLAPILTVVMISAVAINFYQSRGFLFTFYPFAFDPSRFNPVAGLSRIFSTRSLVEMAKDILKLLVIGYLPYRTLTGSIKTFIMLSGMSMEMIISVMMSLLVKILLQVLLALLVLAIFDYYYQQYEYEKNLKMSKYDVKQEHKDIDGDPQVRHEQRKRARSMLMRATLKDIPSSDVLLTNPTQLAVALKYDPENPRHSAPYVVAKGAGKIAERIKEIAGEYNVPIVERKEVARLIYKNCEVGQEIPSELYVIISEILAQIIPMKRRRD
ncbi:MAG: EscU/YscU/HrcU family type III secretion system export apparatus switch protein [Candidatus Wallbacteria bacterium]|nr:EscU/YscU/HrcU family type III secretion system export apparatus switch protein [Candidatus Wallbacteria bacterium]